MRALPESHFSVGFFDVILRGGASDAKDLVVVLAHPHYLIVTTWGSFRQVWSLTHLYSVSYLQLNIIVELEGYLCVKHKNKVCVSCSNQQCLGTSRPGNAHLTVTLGL